METFILNATVLAGGMTPESWDALCRFWQWAFWIGVIVGAAGAVLGLFMRRLQD